MLTAFYFSLLHLYLLLITLSKHFGSFSGANVTFKKKKNKVEKGQVNHSGNLYSSSDWDFKDLATWPKINQGAFHHNRFGGVGNSPPPWPFGKELFDVVSYKNDFAVFCLSIFIMYSIYWKYTIYSSRNVAEVLLDIGRHLSFVQLWLTLTFTTPS